MQRGEGIVRDLRLGARHRGQQRRLAGVGQSDQAGIGDQLQPQPDPALLARPAGSRMARRLVGGALEMRVAEAAVAALAQHDALARLGQVEQHRLLVLVEDLGADRHAHQDVLGLGAGAHLAHAVMAAPHLEMLLVAVVDQRVEVGHRLDHDVAALAAVAAVRPAELDELLAMKADAPGTAVAAFHEDLGFIEEFHGSVSVLTRSVILVLGTRIHEFACECRSRPSKLVDGRAKPDHDGGEGGTGVAALSSNSKTKRGMARLPFPFVRLVNGRAGS